LVRYDFNRLAVYLSFRTPIGGKLPPSPSLAAPLGEGGEMEMNGRGKIKGKGNRGEERNGMGKERRKMGRGRDEFCAVVIFPQEKP